MFKMEKTFCTISFFLYFFDYELFFKNSTLKNRLFIFLFSNKEGKDYKIQTRAFNCLKQYILFEFDRPQPQNK